MYDTTEALKKCYKPYDIVSDKSGSVGFIQEVEINDCQDNIKWQISYSVHWLTGNTDKVAWFEHKDLKKHCNLFEEIAKCSCDQSGTNEENVSKIMKLGVGK